MWSNSSSLVNYLVNDCPEMTWQPCRNFQELGLFYWSDSLSGWPLLWSDTTGPDGYWMDGWMQRIIVSLFLEWFIHSFLTAVLPNFHDLTSWHWLLLNWSKGFPRSGGLGYTFTLTRKIQPFFDFSFSSSSSRTEYYSCFRRLCIYCMYRSNKCAKLCLWFHESYFIE